MLIIGQSGFDDTGLIVPALGDSYSYFPTQRVMILPHPSRSEFRIARLIKSSLNNPE